MHVGDRESNSCPRCCRFANELTQHSVAVVQVLDPHLDVSHTEVHLHVHHLQERPALGMLCLRLEVHLGLHALWNQ